MQAGDGSSTLKTFIMTFAYWIRKLLVQLTSPLFACLAGLAVGTVLLLLGRHPRKARLLIAGATAIYYTYTVDFGMILIKGNFLKDFSNLATNPDFLLVLTTWVPVKYNWVIFAIGMIIICAGIFLILKRDASYKP